MSDDTNAETHRLFLDAHGQLVAAAKGIVRSQAVAEEIAQDGWVRWLSSGARADDAPAFLRKTVVNAAIDWLRSARSEQDRIATPQFRERAVATPEKTAIDRDLIAQVDQVLDGLAPRLKQVFLMRRVDGLTYDEIGMILGISGPRACQLFKQAYLAIVDSLDGLPEP